MAMKRIEMVGVSGVGKTTLYNKIMQVSLDKRDCLTLKEAYKLAALNQEVPFLNFKLWLYQTALKLGLYESKSWGIGKTILHSLAEERLQMKKFEPFIISHLILLEYLKNIENYRQIYKSVSKFFKRVKELLILENSLSEDLPVIVDEGVVHYHPGITDYGIENYSFEELEKDLTFSPAGIISCEQTADAIFQQAMKRKRNGIQTFTHGSMNKKELRDHIEKSVKNHKRKIYNFKKIGIPILHVDTRDKFAINFSKINVFAQFICSNN